MKARKRRRNGRNLIWNWYQRVNLSILKLVLCVIGRVWNIRARFLRISSFWIWYFSKNSCINLTFSISDSSIMSSWVEISKGVRKKSENLSLKCSFSLGKTFIIFCIWQERTWDICGEKMLYGSYSLTF